MRNLRPEDEGSRASDSMRDALERQLPDPRAGEAECLPPLIPDHTLLRRIGRGAYGEVWLARNALGTPRAVKIVYRARFDDDRPFEREFNGILKYEPISRTHDGLMQVLHVGRNQEAGCFYYVMELADDARQAAGEPPPDYSLENPQVVRPRTSLKTDSRVVAYCARTLRTELKYRQRLPPTHAAQLAHRLAGSLAHLHAQGLVHRDIKPANVIFVGGHPKLADIGLVTGAGDSRSFVGTEGFVPPEGPGSAQSDVYGLGKLLYELATGRDRLDFPQLPADLTSLPESEALLELNEVITRACAPSAEQRYRTAADLQADLGLFLAGRSLRQARRTERHLIWLKRFALAACLAMLLSGMALWLAKNSERRAEERERTSREQAGREAALRRRAETAEAATRQQLYSALFEQARATVHSGEAGQRVRALEAVRRAAAISNTAELRGAAMAALALPDLRFEQALPNSSDVTAVSFDPKFERAAICRRGESIEIRSVAGWQVQTHLAASTNLPVYDARWSGDGRYLALARDRNQQGSRADVEVWEVAQTNLLLLLPDVPWGAMAFHPDHRRFMVGEGQLAIVWQLESRQPVAQIPLPGEPWHLRISPQGDEFAIAFESNGVRRIALIDLRTGATVASNPFSSTVGEPDWHPSGRWLVVPEVAGTVHLMDARTGYTRPVGRHKSAAAVAHFSPDGSSILSGGWERELICWDLQTLQRAFTVSLNSYRAQFSGDGRQCAIITDAGIQIFSFQRPFPQPFIENLGARLRHAAFSADSRWLAASGEKGVGIWKDTNPALPARLNEAVEARLFFSPDGELLANRGSFLRRYRLLRPESPFAEPGVERLDLSVPEALTSAASISNEVYLTTRQGTQRVTIDDLAPPQDGRRKTSDGLGAVSPDGRWLAIYRSFTPDLLVYRLPGLEPVATLTHRGNIGTVRFSPSGNEIAASARQQMEIWNTTTWQRTRVLTNVIDVIYTSDERLVWLQRNYRTAGLYEAQSLELVLPLPANTLPLALSPDGDRLAVSVDSRHLQVWDIPKLRSELRELGVDWKDNQPDP